jgi:hypothetical protein
LSKQVLVSRLTHAEVVARGRIGHAKRYGGDVGGARREFEALKAQREIADAVDRLIAARKAQGLPPRITDAATLANIALIIDGAVLPKKKKAADDVDPSAAKRGGHAHDQPAA